MSIPALRLDAFGRGLAYANERRSPQLDSAFTSSAPVVPSTIPTATSEDAGLTATAIAHSSGASAVSSAAPTEIHHASKGVSTFAVKALTGVVAVFGIIILGVVVWMILSWRRKRARRSAPAAARIANFSEGNMGDFSVEKGVDTETSWYHVEKLIGSENIFPPMPVKKSPLRSKLGRDKQNLAVPLEDPPPPVYVASSSPHSQSPYSPPSPPQIDIRPPPHTPPVWLKVTPPAEE